MPQRVSFVRANGLTLVLLGLFLVSLVGHWFTGQREYNDERVRFGKPPLSLAEYTVSGHFLETVAENWESEFLQMMAFVLLSVGLHQRGSPESKEIGKLEPVDRDPRVATITPKTPWPVRKGGLVLAVYERSLGLAFAILFAFSFVLHAAGGRQHENERRERQAQPPIGIGEYLSGSRMWFESFQNWQSEFLSVAAMVYFGVYLRQRGSPESKPVDTPHDEHE